MNATITGYAAVFDARDSDSSKLFRRGCFVGAVRNQANVVACVDHVSGLAVADAASGLTLVEDEVGLLVQIQLRPCPVSLLLAAAMGAGMYSQMSLAYFKEDAAFGEVWIDGRKVREITAVHKLIDVCLTNTPRFPATAATITGDYPWIPDAANRLARLVQSYRERQAAA